MSFRALAFPSLEDLNQYLEENDGLVTPIAMTAGYVSGSVSVLLEMLEEGPGGSGQQTGSAVFSMETELYKVKGENMSTTMQAVSLATVSVAWKDASGQVAKVDGPTAWVSSDPTMVKATVASGNPLICNLESYDKVGDVSIQATADADLGDGVKTVTSVITITVIGGEAVGGDITFKQGGPGPGSPGGGTR